MKLWRDRLVVIVCFPLLLPFIILLLATARDVQVWQAMKEIWRGEHSGGSKEES